MASKGSMDILPVMKRLSKLELNSLGSETNDLHQYFSNHTDSYKYETFYKIILNSKKYESKT